MRASEFNELRSLARVVHHKNFARAAAPTEAGSRLVQRVAPALGELQAAVGELNLLRDKPAGLLRINAPRMAAHQVLAPMLGEFYRKHPQIVLDIVAEDAITDVIAGGFDAGIRLGEKLEKDMVAFPVTGMLELAAVATPAYFNRHGQPQHPRDLQKHRCINIRMPTNGGLYRWEFEKSRRSLEIAVEGPLIVNEPALALQGALEGLGIAYIFEDTVRAPIQAKKLVRVLADWSPPFAGLYLYYPSRRHTPPALRAFIDFVRARSVR